jgi:hypothetical protein
MSFFLPEEIPKEFAKVFTKVKFGAKANLNLWVVVKTMDELKAKRKQFSLGYSHDTRNSVNNPVNKPSTEYRKACQ